MDPEQLQHVAFLAKSLSDLNRLRILYCIRGEQKSVSAIVEELGLSQPLVSHHLKELKHSLLVNVERQGPFIYYELADPRILDVVETLIQVATDLLSGRRKFWLKGDNPIDMTEIRKIVADMAPEAALSAIGAILRDLFSSLDDETKMDFLSKLFGAPGTEKVSSMVHLWLAECMGEGVDPTQMCQSLVDKVGRSKQLIAIAEPELLVLFEDWLEELEAEVIRAVQLGHAGDPVELARSLKVSAKGAHFLFSKLKREGKLGS